MDVDKRKRSKGGFLNLFDWSGKSRKKLFSNSSEVSEESRQERENVHNSSTTRVSVIEVNEIKKSSVYNPRSDSSCCASSVTSDDGYGSRAPSVVARLMGLDSLPVPNTLEPCFNMDLDPFSHSSSQSAIESCDGYKNPSYVNLHDDVDGVPWDHTDSRTIKGHNRPIERFQTETLPPRSAKPISVTHNRLLSPIRSPGFVPSKNPAYVMEAASRMIEPSPRMVTRTRVSSIGPSSSALSRIQNLKEKLEAPRKAPKPQLSYENSNSKYLGGKRDEKRRSMASPVTPGKSKISATGVSDDLKGKVNPSSLSAQAKARNHKQDDPTPSHGNKRAATGQKGISDVKNRIVQRQSGDRGPSLKTGKTMLKQNNQKQDCSDRHQAAKASVSNQKKVMNKVVNKVLVESEIGSTLKKSGSPPSLPAKDTCLSRKRNLQNKKSPNGVQDPRISNGLQIRKGEKSIKCNITIDNDLVLAKDDRKKDIDVISFTFSSPIKGLSSTSLSSTQGIERDIDSAVSFNGIGCDSLNLLLEQKLRELTSKIEASSCSLIQEESLGSTSKDKVNIFISSPSISEKSIQNGKERVLSESESASDCTSWDDNCRVQKMIESEEHEISSISTVTDTDDPGLSCNRSCSDCRDNTADGMKQSSSNQEPTWVSSMESRGAEDETEISESVATLTTFSEAEEWPDSEEIDYITEILSSDRLMLEEFSLGTAQDVLPPSLFHETGGRGDPTAKIERKLLFDCVNELLTEKCERVFTGRQGIMVLERREWLGQELKREIQGMEKMREMVMVDEVVGKDMSRCEGGWVDYEKEAYEEGIEIERDIVSALVDDLVYDLLNRKR